MRRSTSWKASSVGPLLRAVLLASLALSGVASSVGTARADGIILPPLPCFDEPIPLPRPLPGPLPADTAPDASAGTSSGATGMTSGRTTGVGPGVVSGATVPQIQLP